MRHRTAAARIDGHVAMHVVVGVRVLRVRHAETGAHAQHRIAVRQTILGFAESEADRRTIIRLDPELVPVRALPRRAHQGWRYLAPADAPPDLDGAGDGLTELPPNLAEKLAVLALI